MKVFIDTRDGDLLIMQSRTCFKWLTKNGYSETWPDSDSYSDVWDEEKYTLGTFVRVSVKRYYDKIEST